MKVERRQKGNCGCRGRRTGTPSVRTAGCSFLREDEGNGDPVLLLSSVADLS